MNKDYATERQDIPQDIIRLKGKIYGYAEAPEATANAKLTEISHLLATLKNGKGRELLAPIEYSTAPAQYESLPAWAIDVCMGGKFRDLPHGLQADKALRLFNLLGIVCQQPDITGKEYTHLYTARAGDNITLLQKAIRSNDARLFEAVLEKFKSMWQRGQIDDEEYRWQLLQADSKHNLPLNVAVYNRNEPITSTIVRELDDLRTHGKIHDQDYIECFTLPQGGSSLLHLAVQSGNPKIFKLVSEKLHMLHDEGLIDEKLLHRQYAARAKETFSILHSAINTGRADLFRLVIDDMLATLPLPNVQNELLVRIHGTTNLMHFATRPDFEKGFPTANMVDEVQSAFFKAFGTRTLSRNSEAVRQLRALYEERTETGHPAYHDRQPLWLRKILAMSDYPDRAIPPTPLVR
jgi:hypothetical protein